TTYPLTFHFSTFPLFHFSTFPLFHFSTFPLFHFSTYFGSPLLTHLLGVPVPNGLSADGRHSETCSICFASRKSLSVIPPALWVDSFTVTFAQVTARS